MNDASPEIKNADNVAEDQQRINSFSKLNTKLRGLEGKLEELKVREQHHVFDSFRTLLQQEKEALDDLAMELELADESGPVMCMQCALQAFMANGYQVQNWRNFPPYAALSRTKTPRERSTRH